MIAVPAEHFAIPPYRAELFNPKTGWSGVMNAHDINVLTFPNRPGVVITSFAEAQRIAAEWNNLTQPKASNDLI